MVVSWRVLVVPAACLSVIAASIVYKYRTDARAWDQVQEKLVRLRSGLQFESIMTLRTRLADADAAVKIYAARWRIFPPDRKQRIREAQRAIDYLASGINWQTGNRSRETDSSLNQKEVRGLEGYPEVTANIVRLCAEGRIWIARTSVAGAFTSIGMHMLERSEYPPASGDASFLATEKYSPLDFEKETAECQRQEAARKEAEQRQEAARKEAEQRRYWAQFRYRVGLTLSPLEGGTCVFDLNVDGKNFPSIELSPGRTQEFGANRDMAIRHAECYGAMVSREVIKVKINGQLYQPKWNPRGASIIPTRP